MAREDACGRPVSVSTMTLPLTGKSLVFMRSHALLRISGTSKTPPKGQSCSQLLSVLGWFQVVSAGNLAALLFPNRPCVSTKGSIGRAVVRPPSARPEDHNGHDNV
ncbi:hypothetical protein ACJQWK_07157 [Exserohilum turcicum]